MPLKLKLLIILIWPVVLLNCGRPADQAKTNEKSVPLPVTQGAQTFLATSATKPSPSATPAPVTTTLRTGEQPELQRKLLLPEPGQRDIAPEDYASGPLLALNATDSSDYAEAMAGLRAYFLALSRSESIAAWCSPAALRFSETIFSPYHTELTTIKSIRFLANHHFESSEMAFDIRLICANSSARLQFYLTRSNPKTKWLISDIQGSAATLSQASETGYTDYVPQEDERGLLREGHIK